MGARAYKFIPSKIVFDEEDRHEFQTRTTGIFIQESLFEISSMTIILFNNDLLLRPLGH